MLEHRGFGFGSEQCLHNLGRLAGSRRGSLLYYLPLRASVALGGGGPPREGSGGDRMMDQGEVSPNLLLEKAPVAILRSGPTEGGRYGLRTQRDRSARDTRQPEKAFLLEGLGAAPAEDGSLDRLGDRQGVPPDRLAGWRILQLTARPDCSERKGQERYAWRSSQIDPRLP